MKIKGYGKLVTDSTDPWCEHCNTLEIGSFVFDGGCVNWCIGCVNANEPIPSKKMIELLKSERLNKIAAHTKRIKELEDELSNN